MQAAQSKCQDRKHLFKNCTTWRSEQKTLWGVVLRKTKKRKAEVQISEEHTLHKVLRPSQLFH